MTDFSDDAIDSLLIDVRASTTGFARDVAAMRGAFDTTLVDGFARAGTVLEPAQVAAVEAAGGQFLVSPGVSPALLDALAASPLPSVPGAATPSELMALHARGFHVAKWFPAAMLGGVATLKAIQGPLPQMKLCANGGIDASSAADYLALPNVACVGGSWMLPADAIKA